MPEYNISDYGLAGMALVGMIYVVLKVIDMRSTTKEPENDQISTNADMKNLLENNTKAIERLTQFLETQAKVDEEKEKHSVKMLESMGAKLDQVLDAQLKHHVRCSATCHINGGRNNQ